MGATPMMNRSAKDGARSSPHYGGEGVTHSPIVPRCLLTARYGRFMRDPRRPAWVPAQRPGKRQLKLRVNENKSKVTRATAANLTVSQISAPRRCCDWSIATWTSRQASDERADQPRLSLGCDARAVAADPL